MVAPFCRNGFTAKFDADKYRARLGTLVIFVADASGVGAGI